MTQLRPYTVVDSKKDYYINPVHAYICLSFCVNINIIMSFYPAVAPFAPITGFIAGIGMIYLFSNGYR